MRWPLRSIASNILKTLVPRFLMAVLPVPSEQMMMFLGIRERFITNGAAHRTSSTCVVDLTAANRRAAQVIAPTLDWVYA